ncbi:dephospho-CoA kinase [Candidatus Peregrinibacteria bacterium]|nr:dephospho-CoA kinase [Candidatus Peregrinibacteria bacterium]
MILGITGISGSGKHTAAHYFEQRGWVILDADKIAHHSYRPYTAVWKAVVREFGEGILNQDDTINRVKLGKIVFSASEPEESEKALSKLNQIVHPYMKRRIKNEIHRHFRRQSNIAIVVALWRESDLEDCCEKILLIKADPALRRKRIQGRDGISPETYEMRVKNQTEPPQPDFIVENSGSLTDFREKLGQLGL